jgi:hypothetical protein
MVSNGGGLAVPEPALGFSAVGEATVSRGWTTAGSAAMGQGRGRGRCQPARDVHLLEVSGCTVEFPFQPYDCQVASDAAGDTLSALAA